MLTLNLHIELLFDMTKSHKAFPSLLKQMKVFFEETGIFTSLSVVFEHALVISTTFFVDCEVQNVP